MNKPSYEDMGIAQEWLDANEGTDGESDSCKAVAKWLRQQMAASLERASARSAGVPVRKLRAVIARNSNDISL